MRARLLPDEGVEDLLSRPGYCVGYWPASAWIAVLAEANSS